VATGVVALTIGLTWAQADLARADSPVTYCVANSACVAAGGTSEPDLQSALNAAQANIASNTIQIGPNVSGAPFTAAGGGPFSYAPGPVHALTITGAGRTQTTLTTASASTGGVLSVSAGPVTVTDLAIVIVPSSGSTSGFSSNTLGDLQRVDITDGAGSTGNVQASLLAPASVGTQTLDHVAVTVASPLSVGITRGTGGGTLTIQDSQVTMSGPLNASANATLAINLNDGATNVLRSRIAGLNGIRVTGASLTAEDDVITQIPVTGGGGGSPDVNALQIFDSPGTAGTLQGRHLTIYGVADQPYPYSYGVEAKSSFAGGVSAALHNSVIANVDAALLATVVGSGTTAHITTDYSDYAKTGDTGVAPSEETHYLGTSGGGLTDPLFLAPATGTGGDFHLRAASPLIDAGDPAAPAGESTTDFSGLPRVVHGRRDVGAYEYQPLVASATQSATTAVAGTPVSFDGSGSTDPNPGHGPLTFAWAFDDGAAATGAAVSHAWTTTGTHTATLTVSDGSPVTAQTVKTVAVTAPASRPPSGLPGGTPIASTGGPPGPRIVLRPTAPSATLTWFSERLQRLLSHGLDVRAGCSVACRMTVQLVLDARTARAVGLRTRSTGLHKPREAVVGHATITLRAGVRRKLAVRLTAAAKRHVRHRSPLTMTVRGIARPLHGGPAVTVRHRLSLRR
jgi:hypothetical protein